MKTLATIVVEIDYENKYDAVGIPDMEDAIMDNIKEIQENTFGYEWDLETDVAYVEGNLKIIEIKPIEIIEPEFMSLPCCEHCGENHTEFGAEFNVDGVSWCLNCYLTDKPNYSYLYDYYSKLEKEKHIKYLENKLSELKKSILDE